MSIYTYYLDVDNDFKNQEQAEKFIEILEEMDIEISDVAYDSFSMIVFDASQDQIKELNKRGLTSPPINVNLSQKNELEYYLSVIKTNSDYDSIPLNTETIKILEDASKKAERNKFNPIKVR